MAIFSMYSRFPGRCGCGCKTRFPKGAPILWSTATRRATLPGHPLYIPQRPAKDPIPDLTARPNERVKVRIEDPNDYESRMDLKDDGDFSSLAAVIDLYR